jgi:rare lipoprotein A (peptidoglycan hydrolase)
LLDVSRAVAERLGFVSSGKAPVKVTVVRYPKGYVPRLIAVPVVACVKRASY